MFNFWVTACVLAVLAAIGFGITSLVIDQRASIAISNLQLADDASTPEQKAVFLRAFIADMDKAELPTYSAWVWRSERNKIANQRIVIESLIARCDALATLNKESMGYSQGMTQVTGQEFDHATGEISDIYAKAFTMSYGWFLCNGWVVLVGIAAFCGVAAFITMGLNE